MYEMHSVMFNRQTKPAQAMEKLRTLYMFACVVGSPLCPLPWGFKAIVLIKIIELGKVRVCNFES
jgi:hypothetical protein